MPLNVRHYVPYYAYIAISISQGEPPELVESKTCVYVYILAGFSEFDHVHMYVGKNLCTEDFTFDYIFYGSVRTLYITMLIINLEIQKSPCLRSCCTTRTGDTISGPDIYAFFLFATPCFF